MMVAVTIEGVRRSFWRHDTYIVSLWHEGERRLLDIGIGQQEAYTLVMEMQHIASPRPTTLHLMVNTFKALGVMVEEVRIESFATSPLPVFYAVVRLGQGDMVQELDARPSDALGLAAFTQCPIVVKEDVLERVGIVLPEGQTPELHYAEQLLKHERIVLTEGKKLRLGYSKTPARDAVIREVKAALLGIPEPSGEKEFEQAKENYLAFLLGQYPEKGS